MPVDPAVLAEAQAAATAALARLQELTSAASAVDTEAQAAANRRSGVFVSDGRMQAQLFAGSIAHDDPTVLAQVAADQKAEEGKQAAKARGTRAAEGRAAARARYRLGEAHGAATEEPQTDVEKARAEARRRHAPRTFA